MHRVILAGAALVVLAACGQAAPESDNPQPGAAPPSEAIAEASHATAAEPPVAFMQCKVCHTTQAGQHLVGPSLAGVYGRTAASARGYPYSAALKQAGLTWDDATLDRFLTAPMKAVPGTRMTYSGLQDRAARGEIVAYLKTL